MDLELDITSDFEEVVDWLKPITLTLRRNGNLYYITHAHRNQVDTTEHTVSGGDVRQGDTIWQFPVAESVSVATNLLGSKITDEDGQTHTILSAALQVWNSKWEVRTRNLAIESGLDTTVTLIAIGYYKHSSSGEAVESWTTVTDNLAAKIQLETASVSADNHADQTDRSYRITLAEELSIVPGPNYLIQDVDGTIYRIRSYHASEQIDALPYLITKREE